MGFTEFNKQWFGKLSVTGMFLYARIVLDNVEMLYDVEAIKKDLRALPKDLNEAWVVS